MRKDKEKRAPARVTRRSGTRMDRDPDLLEKDERNVAHDTQRTKRAAYEERYARDDRRDDRDYRRDERDYRRDDRDYRRDDRDYRRDDRDYRRDDRDYRRDDRDYRRDDRDYRRDERDYRRDHRDDCRDERDDRREDRAARRAPEREHAPQGRGARVATQPPRRGGNPDRTAHQLVPYVLFCISIFAAVSFFLRDVAGLDGEAGTFGSFLADFLCGLFGIVAYALPVFMFVLALRWRSFVKKGLLLPKILLSGSFLLLLSGIIHVFRETASTRGMVDTTPGVLYGNGVARVGGGFFGGFVGEYLGFIFRLPGTIILAIPLLLIIAIYLIGMTPAGIWQRIVYKLESMREKQAARQAERYDGKEQSARKLAKESAAPAVAPAKEKKQLALTVTEWREPRPLSQSESAYQFVEEEDEPIVPTRPQSTQKSQPSAPASSASAPTYAAPPAPEQVLREAMARESAPPVSEPAPAAPSAPKAQPAYEGQVYAPFALPVQPFPKRAQTAASAAPVKDAADFAFAASTPVKPFAPVEEKPQIQEDELLGVFRPAQSAPAAPAPERESLAGDQADTFGFFVPEQEKPASAQQTPVAFEEEREAVVTERFGGTPVSPFASFAVEEEPEEIDSPAADSFGGTPVSPFSAFVSEEEPEEDEAFEPISEEIEEEIEDEPEEGFSFASASESSFGTSHKEYFAPLFAKDDEPEDESAPVVARTERVEPRFAAFDAPVAPAASAPAATARVAVHTAPVREEPVEPEPVMREYVRPPIHLLNEDKNVRTRDFYDEIEETKDILRQTMASFNIKIQDEINYSHGPSVTRYEMRPVAGTSVRSVTNRTEDIALNLASSVRIEAPIPGKPAIGIEVPNKVRETVFMRTMLESDAFRSSTDPLDVPLGLDVGGSVRMCNLAKMPHLLVAGTTGSGKSVCINTMLLSLIYKTSPRDLRLILIDPKQIEFAPYEDVPHLYMPIVTDMQRAAGALACAVQEMERRFSLIKDVGVRNIDAYNEAVKNDPDREHLPYIVIVIDEFNDLKMSCNNNDPENFTVRIAQKARAAGIHLIIGTQRPSVDVITGKLKGNIPSRIAFMVKQQVDSRTILDVNGAEALTGRGDMLYVATTSSDKNPVRIQGAFVSDGELERVISFVRHNNDPVRYNKAFMDQIEIEMAKSAKQERKGDDFDYADEDEGGEDPKFIEAVELAVQTQKVATSLLQRRLGVGYGRAAKIIDRMEELGLVSPAEGNKPRKLLPAAQGYLAHIGAMDAESEFEDDYS